MGGKAKFLILIAFFSICTITLGVFLVSGGPEDDIHCGLYGDFCEGLLGSDDSDINAGAPLGDRPFVKGTCIEGWEECVECFGGALSGVDEGDYQPVGGRTVSFAAVSFAENGCTSDYCDFFSYPYTDYCVGDVLREYYLRYTENPDPAENVSECGRKSYNCPSVFGAGYTCQNGRCVQCTNECGSEGLRRCSGNNVQECRANWDGDACLEWGTIQSCGAGEECRGARCLDPGTCTCEGCVFTFNGFAGADDTDVDFVGVSFAPPGPGECESYTTVDDCNYAEGYYSECGDCSGAVSCDYGYSDVGCWCEKPPECTSKSDCVINSGPGYGGTFCYSCDPSLWGDCWYAGRGTACSVNLPPTVYGQCDGGDRCSCWENMSCVGDEYCNICDNIYPGDYYCSSGKCCPVGSYWDDVNGVCKRVRHEECCDSSSWDDQTRCGGCCGAGLSENCSAYDESYPYYWHDQNEIWQCDYGQNQDSVYDFVYDCDQSDGCYASGNGCEDRDYSCAHNMNGIGYDAYCDPSISNQQTDYIEPLVNYCLGDEVRRHDWSHDYYCNNYGATFNGTCTDHGSWVNDQLVEDCDVYDGWNGGGDIPGCGDDPISIYTDYSCSGGACTSSDTETQDCDGSDVCGNVCDGTVIKSYLDYYVITDSDQCDFEWGSTIEDCAARLPTDSDGGDVPSAAGTCTSYTGGCSGGACPSSTYTDVCDSGTQLTEYYNISNNLCPSKTYSCSDFEAAASGDTLDNPATTGTCTGGTGAGCSSGAFSTTSGSSGTEGCIDSNDCSGGANCVFREYYASDSADACPGLDTCTAKTYDPDTNSNTCSACIGSGKYDIGGISGCCGDDSSENILTSQCDGYACDTNLSDDACCDDADDCVLNDVCYNDGADLPGQTGATCVNGVWEDITAPTTAIDRVGIPGWINNWYGSDVQVTLTCSDTGGSNCDTTMYCVDTTDTCSPSTTYSIPFNITSEGINYVRFYSTDNAGNQETPTQSTEIKIDKTNPVFNSYSISGCDYTDNPNQICWVQSGTQTTHRIQHSDSLSTPWRQYITFTSGCNPNGCGCNWGELCSSGDEIKSSVSVDTGAVATHMWNDDYLDISAVSCIGVCTGTDIEEEWTVTAGTNEKDYAIYTFLYDEAGREIGYTNTGWQLIIDDTDPDISIVINNDDVYANSTSVTLSLTYSDPGGSGVSDCRYRNEGEAWTPWEACTATRSWTLTTGNGVKTVYYEVRDLALNVKQENDFITLDTTSPTTAIDRVGIPGWSNNWYGSDVQVTLTCSDTGGSNCDTTMYCVDTTDTCSPSTTYSIPFNITSEGTNYVRFYSTDIAGNQETPTQSTEIKIDKTNPVFNSYSISGCDYTDNPNQICWVQSGTQTTHRIQHTDSPSTPWRQYLTFTSGCNPNGCGCNWGELCSSGDEIKSSVSVDTGAIATHMWNDDYLDISAVSCVGDCTGTDIEEEWTVTTGTNEKDYAIYTFLYDEAGRETGYIDTGWGLNSDNTPPDTEVADLPEYSMATIPLSWGGTDGGSGIECYRVEYTYEDSPDGWTKPRNLEDCTGFTTYDFEIDYELDVPDPEMLNNYTFYFRSMGKDWIDNWETPPAVPDANTTIFIPRLIEISAQSNETGKLIRDKGWFPKGKEITISAKAKDDVPENLDIKIYYSNHTRGATPSWTLYECNNTRSCNVTIGPFESGEVAYYVRAAVFGDPANWERSPPVPGYWRFYIASHPLCNFLVTDVLTMILGSRGLIGIEVRNIQDQFDVIGLNFSTNFAKFVETDSQYTEVQLNPGEGVNVPKIIYARLVSSSDNFQLTLGGNSSIDSTMFDMDTIEVVIGYPADFSGLSDFAVIILVLLAVLIYLKFVRIEN